MRNILKIFIFTLFSLIMLNSCEKGGLFDCFKTTGKIVTEDRYAEEFNTISLNDNMNLYITQSDHYAISVEAGKNLQKDIKTDIKDKVLTISNNNSCNWTRSYNKPMNVHVHVIDLKSIQYNSSGDIYSTNTIESDSIQVDIWDGGGSISLDLKSWKSRLYNHKGTVDITVTGFSDVNYIFNNSYGPVDCLNLNTTYTFMKNRSSNDCYVNVNLLLEATIENIGNIYYMGNPEIHSNITGSGKLIKLN